MGQTIVFCGLPRDWLPWRRLDSRLDYDMRKGFTRKPQGDEPATRGKNYITPSGLQRLKEEHRFLLTRERPAVTKVVAWAASNGDRSENADYQYGKRRLRQIDGRIRFLTKRIDAAEVVDPERPRAGQAATRAFFGATVRYANAAGTQHSRRRPGQGPRCRLHVQVDSRQHRPCGLNFYNRTQEQRRHSRI